MRLTSGLADLSQVFSEFEKSVILNLLQGETGRNSKAERTSHSSPKKNPVFKAEFKTENTLRGPSETKNEVSHNSAC